MTTNTRNFSALVKRETVLEKWLHQIDQDMFETEDRNVLHEFRVERASIENELAKIRLTLYVENGS